MSGIIHLYLSTLQSIGSLIKLRYTVLFEVPVPRQESGRSCIFVLAVSMLALSSIVLMYFGTVPIMWYFFVFQFLYGNFRN